MRIGLVTGECNHVVDYTGMANVVRELGRALQKKGHEVCIVLPLFGAALQNIAQRKGLTPNELGQSEGNDGDELQETAWLKRFDEPDLRAKLIDRLFDRSPEECEGFDVFTFQLDPETPAIVLIDSGAGLREIVNQEDGSRRILWSNYLYDENTQFSSKAVEAALRQFNKTAAVWLLQWKAEAIHCFNWESALVPRYVKESAENSTPKLVLGIDLLDLQPEVNLVNMLQNGIEQSDVLHFPNAWWKKEVCNIGSENAHGLGAVLSDQCHKVKYATYAINTHTYRWGDPLLAAGVPEHVVDSNNTQAMLSAAKQMLLKELKLQPLDANSPGPVFLVGNRLSDNDQKNYALVKAGMEKILQEHTEVRLVLRLFPNAEEGPIRTMWRSLEELCQFKGRVAVVPIIERDDKRYSELTKARRNWSFLMLGSDIVLMPSRFEPAGLNHLQAMYCGCPVIGTRVGGMADIISSEDDVIRGTPRNGWLLEPYRSSDDFGNACNAFVDACNDAISAYGNHNRWNELVESARMSVLDWDRVVDSYEDLYR